VNVLSGDMSLVGPRPSPDRENRLCPAWRDARLSVRPGITGLWQVCRTRQPGLDFQEWIQFDTQYVKSRSLSLDCWIIWRTLRGLAAKETQDGVVETNPA
jgi:lipopolysaccharide/colanic/teichoic acid biosynthesis glycosyltransferase